MRAARDAIARRYRGRPIVIYRRSLGTGLAAAAKRAYPLAPEWLLKYPCAEIVGEVTSLVMLLHGRDDILIPYADSERLASRLRVPVDVVIVDGAGHNDIHRSAAYLEAIAARLAELAPR